MDLFWLLLIRQHRLGVMNNQPTHVMNASTRMARNGINCRCPSVVFIYVWRLIFSFKLKMYIWVTEVRCFSSVWQWLSVVGFEAGGWVRVYSTGKVVLLPTPPLYVSPSEQLWIFLSLCYRALWHLKTETNLDNFKRFCTFAITNSLFVSL